MKMNLRKTFYFVALSALALAAAIGILLVPGLSTSGTTSAAQEARGEVATPAMIAYALTHKSDASFRFNVINQLPCQELSGDLSGKTVAPGVYCVASADLAGELTLDGQGDKASTFIFRVGGALNAKGGTVALANDAQSANVFFVAESAVLTGGADFRGNILTKKSIKIDGGSVLKGKAESLSGEVPATENAIVGGGTGTLEICKTIDASSVDISNRIFQFTVTGVAGVIEVPVGSCSSPIDVPAGPATVTELNGGRTLTGGTFTGNFVLNRVETVSQNSTSTLGLVNLSTRTATVNVVEGGIPQQLTLRFVNQFAITGVVEICKYAATGPGGFNATGDLDVTGFFNFNISGVFTTNTQNPQVRTEQVFTTPVGQCTGPIAVTVSNPTPTTGTPRIGAAVVTELPKPGAFLESVDTIPTDRLLQFIPGFCVVPGAIIAPGSNSIDAQPCAGGGLAVVQIVEGGAASETVVNFRNRSNPGQFKVCKIAGPGVPENTLFRFTVSGLGATNATTPQFTTYGQVERIVDVRAGLSTANSPNGNCQLVPGFGSGAGNAEFQTFVNGTPVTVVENGISPANTIPQPTGQVRTSRIRVNFPSAFATTAQAGFTPNPDLTPAADGSFVSRAAVIQRAAITEIEFTNFRFNPTLLKVCKIGAGTIATDGSRSFTFDVTLQSPNSADGAPLFPAFTAPVTVAAGPTANGGFCAFVNGAGLQGGAFNQGSTVTITERAPGTGVTVTGISSVTSAPTPAGANGGLNVDLANRRATLIGQNGLVAGTNVVTFTNTGTGSGLPAVPFDFDGDRRSDFSIFRPSTTTFWYAASSANQQQRAITFGLATDLIVPMDYDGDGRTDAAVFRPSNGTWYILGSTAGFSAVQFGLSGDIPMPGDYDGDGRADVAVFRPSNGTWYILGSTAGFSAVQFGLNGDVPVAADYDGDRRTDVAVYRNGTWFILKSTEGFAAAAFGLATDIPVPADYDGDGRADLAVYRGGNWFIQGSTAGFRSVQFGLPTDQPVPADYDGDGKTDIAVYRNSVWFYISSSTGATDFVVFGIPGDIPVPAAFLKK